MACTASALYPSGWNYDPFKYYPFTALQPPVEETVDIAAARHLGAHAAVRPVPVVVTFQPARQV